MPETESLDLLRQVREGDEQAAAELFDRYVDRLQALARQRLSPKLARRLDPEDVVQSVYRSFFHHARDGRYRISESGDLWRLLAAITVNKVRNQAKHHAAAKRTTAAERSCARSGSILGIPPEAMTEAPSPVEANVLVEAMEDAMARLPSEYHRILQMQLQGRSAAEIAGEISCSERKVHRARGRFKRILEARLVD